MKRLAVPISDPELEAFVRDLVASGTYANPSDYVASLISADRRQRAKAKLESLLLTGLKDERSEVTDKDWDDMRQQYDKRHARRKKK